MPGSTSSQLPWVEKYRPATLDDIAHQEDVVKTLKRTIDTANLPHLLFYGPPGTGKTSTILAAAKQLYGPKLIKKRVLELNASNERGIDVIRNKVKAFAQIAVGTADSDPDYPCPPYKIIVLDEADSMTTDAQSALRRTMELHTKVTRFCIICNYVSRIIEPISSRCAKFRFQSLSHDSMLQRLTHIASEEECKVDDDSLEALVEVAGGDMRRSITLMQSAQRLVGPNETLTKNLVFDVAGMIPWPVIDKLLVVCGGTSFTDLQTAAKDAIADGYAVDQVLLQLSRRVVVNKEMTSVQKSHISVAIAEAESKLIQGADEHLQLLNVLSVCNQHLNSPSTS